MEELISNCPSVKTGKGITPQNQFIWLGSAGAVISAILASACCVAPFILATLGVSGAWIGSLRAFGHYDPLFKLITICFLATGFYKVYGKKTEVCEPGSLCAVPQTKKISKIILWTATFIVIFLIAFPFLVGVFI